MLAGFGKIICPGCGHMTPEEVGFCYLCGENLTKTIKIDAPETENHQNLVKIRIKLGNLGTLAAKVA